MVTASRWISMTLFSVFVLKLLFQLRTHSTLFDLADGKEAETDDDADDADDDDDEHIRRPSLDLSALAMVFLLLFLAITICAYNLAAALSRLDVSEPDYSLAPSEMQRFISLIFFTILPIVLEIPGGLKFVSLAIENRMDLAVQANLESIIHIFLFHTPVLVLTGWIMGTDLALDFKDTQMFAAGLSIVLTMHYIQNGASTYLNGAMMISLYVVISVAISLDGIWF
ncbi:hypothetical protein L207DRAFT_221094 [Hyaloscypha variabilis F]|uniref:Sodium/calcium exchanger membrane region domain-containing protein n=1 Tax=Hyaloscypha variabilis (strain UAMH 11265 / GT02V1 / F) TaxID=1149755 RepID=A0A2J6S7Q6_HYAVF|nr:hypothetical protein L207DRAFT_221094 [Hyaloscypha variabilis F]